MGFEWSEKGPLDQYFDDYKRGHVDGWETDSTLWKQYVLFVDFLRIPLRLHLGRFTEQLTCCN